MSYVYLNVSYNEKNDAKELGAKFDFEKKLWYCKESDREIFEKWDTNHKSFNRTYNHYSPGAIQKSTCEIVFPHNAHKNEKYKCPECEKDVFLRKGKILRPHFAHFKNSNCIHFNDTNESQIHIDAKKVLQEILEAGNSIKFIKTCCCCHKYKKNIIFTYNENYKIVLEYYFIYKGKKKYADIAILDNEDKIVAIIEVCNTHPTLPGNRPEPWFEVNAHEVVDLKYKDIKNSNIKINCVREYFCDKRNCKYNQKKISKINKLNIQKCIEKERRKCDLCNGVGIMYMCEDMYMTCPGCQEELKGASEDEYFDSLYKCKY